MGEVILVESLDGLSPTSTTLKRTFTKNKKKIKKEKRERECFTVLEDPTEASGMPVKAHQEETLLSMSLCLFSSLYPV